MKTTLSNYHKVACLATIPSRRSSLQGTLDSLYHQVDRLCVYFNGWNGLPDYLDDYRDKLEVVTSQQTGKDLGDAGKFWWSTKMPRRTLIFTCDDDILYSANYCRSMAEYCLENNFGKCVGIHGKILHQLPLPRFYLSRRETRHTPLKKHMTILHHIDEQYFPPTPVHILGTGVMVHCTDTVKFPIEVFQNGIMSDIWAAKYCQQAGIGQVCYYNGGLITEIHTQDRICATYTGNDQVQTDVVNAIDWQMF